MATGIRLFGFNPFTAYLARLLGGLASEGPWWVATAVWYAIPLEFAKDGRGEPFFMVGLLRVAQTDGAVGTLRGGGLFRVLVAEDRSVVQEIATTAERAIKDVIVEKGLIETSALLDSVVAADSLEGAIGESVAKARAVNPRAVAL